MKPETGIPLRFYWLAYAYRLSEWEQAVRNDPWRPRHASIERFVELYVDTIYTASGSRL